MDATVATAGKECQLGTDPAKFLERFEDWYEHHDLLADTMGVEANKKLKLLLLWSGKEFRKFAKFYLSQSGNITQKYKDHMLM